MGEKRKDLRSGLSRTEAELLVDLLMLVDHYPAEQLEDDIRATFGMCSRDAEIEASGITLEERRRGFAEKLLRELP